MTLMTELSEGLLRADGSILRSPAAQPASSEYLRLVEEALAGEAEDKYPLVESFDGGALVEILFVKGDTSVVAIAGQAGIMAAITTNDQGEADSLYAHMAERIGILGEKCSSCGTAIPSVYEYCAECV